MPFIVDVVGQTPPPGAVLLKWAAIDPGSVPNGSVYTGYRVALQGIASPPEQYVPFASTATVFTGPPTGDYVGQAQLSIADLSEVDTTIVRIGTLTYPGQTTGVLL